MFTKQRIVYGATASDYRALGPRRVPWKCPWLKSGAGYISAIKTLEAGHGRCIIIFARVA